jgi:hypothetical protein
MSQRALARSIIFLGLIAGACLPTEKATAGNEANFVLYDHHTDEQGETELNVFGDFSNALSEEPRYNAQLFEIERALTDRWEAALYLEGDKIDGEDYLFGGWRLESRYRLFDYGAFLNPVLYVEYENLDPDHKYLLDVTGRTDTPEGPEQTKHEIESKLIVGRDITRKLDVAFNWINETNLDTGRWEFGYALGFNYALVGEANQEAEEHEHEEHRRGEHATGSGWAIKEIKLGGELYGGLGDSTFGLTLDPNVTQQYAGLNLKTEWSNGLHLMVGGAAGLTKESERGLLRLMLGYEFESLGQPASH